MLIHRSRNASPRDPTKFPTTQLALLALVRAAEPIALTSIFPYAWKLVLSFHIGNRSDASFYAGLLIAAFALAESLTGKQALPCLQHSVEYSNSISSDATGSSS